MYKILMILMLIPSLVLARGEITVDYDDKIEAEFQDLARQISHSHEVDENNYEFFSVYDESYLSRPFHSSYTHGECDYPQVSMGISFVYDQAFVNRFDSEIEAINKIDEIFTDMNSAIKDGLCVNFSVDSYHLYEEDNGGNANQATWGQGLSLDGTTPSVVISRARSWVIDNNHPVDNETAVTVFFTGNEKTTTLGVAYVGTFCYFDYTGQADNHGVSVVWWNPGNSSDGVEKMTHTATHEVAHNLGAGHLQDKIEAYEYMGGVRVEDENDAWLVWSGLHTNNIINSDHLMNAYLYSSTKMNFHKMSWQGVMYNTKDWTFPANYDGAVDWGTNFHNCTEAAGNLKVSATGEEEVSSNVGYIDQTVTITNNSVHTVVAGDILIIDYSGTIPSVVNANGATCSFNGNDLECILPEIAAENSTSIVIRIFNPEDTSTAYRLEGIHSIVDMNTVDNSSTINTTISEGKYISVILGLDTDGDGEADEIDTDDDNDGVVDELDEFPLDDSETIDTDNDGIGNNADTDDDNDGVVDSTDNCNLVSNVDQLDTDSDGSGNVCDTDDDNDGVLDTEDYYPLDSSRSEAPSNGGGSNSSGGSGGGGGSFCIFLLLALCSSRALKKKKTEE